MLNAIWFYRVSRWLYLHHVPLLPTLITAVIYLIYNCRIPHTAEIGRGTVFGYAGMGVVVHKNAKIGSQCIVGQQVTIGGEF